MFGADGQKEITRSISPLKVFIFLEGKPVIVSDLDSITQQLGDRAPVRYVAVGRPCVSKSNPRSRVGQTTRIQLGQNALQDWQTRFRTCVRVEKMLSLCKSFLDNSSSKPLISCRTTN